MTPMQGSISRDSDEIGLGCSQVGENTGVEGKP